MRNCAKIVGCVSTIGTEPVWNAFSASDTVLDDICGALEGKVSEGEGRGLAETTELGWGETSGGQHCSRCQK